MHERSLVSVKVEPHSTSSLNSALFYLASILFTCLKFTCFSVGSQKCVGEIHLKRPDSQTPVKKTL